MKQAKYSEISDYLLKLMTDNRMKVGDRLPTEKELTERFQVSRITVQNALQDLAEKGYVFRKQGSGSYVNRDFGEANAKSISVVPVIIIYNGYSNRGLEIIRGVERYFDEQSIYMALNITYGDPAKERAIVDKLKADGFRSLLVMPTNSLDNRDLYAGLVRENWDIVCIDHTLNGLAINYVASDNISGGYAITERLIKMGYRRIAVISPDPLSSYSSFVARFQGYRNALESNGIDYDPALFCEAANMDGVPAEVDRLLAHRPDAIFVLNDIAAVTVYQRLQEKGVQVPDQMILAGYDNLDIEGKQGIGLTADQDFFRIGYEAAGMLTRVIRTRDRAVNIREIPVKLVERTQQEDL